jgi:hypothetical protein
MDEQVSAWVYTARYGLEKIKEIARIRYDRLSERPIYELNSRQMEFMASYDFLFPISEGDVNEENFREVVVAKENVLGVDFGDFLVGGSVLNQALFPRDI